MSGSPPRPSPVRRRLLLAAGFACVALGAVGLLLPVLPTTPFLLLAAAAFARSSERMYRWLHENRVFGEYLRRYRDGEGWPLGTRLLTIALLWTSLGLSAWLAVPDRLAWVRLALLGIGLGVTVHLARMRPRAHAPSPSEAPPRRGPGPASG